ncbi:MAG: DUF72 domain-containing protein [Acidobacteriota bacterium]
MRDSLQITESADLLPILMSSNTIRIGPAGWSYKDWEGIVYPPHGSRFDHLAYLAGLFDTIEVNSSFYRIPPPTHGTSWNRRVAFNDDFRFTVKLYRGFTHDENSSREDVEAFRRFLDPLHDSGRLGSLLIQFPWSFKRSENSMERIAGVLEHFHDYPKVVEVRHASFQNPEFHRFLDERNTGLVAIDQPLFSDSVKPSVTSTGPLAYVRFHGRNYEKWFAHKESWERYDYLYSERELAPWSARIEAMATERDVFVIMNNHFRGQAIINAVDMERSLGLPVRIPPPMVALMEERWARSAEQGKGR